MPKKNRSIFDLDLNLPRPKPRPGNKRNAIKPDPRENDPRWVLLYPLRDMGKAAIAVEIVEGVMRDTRTHYVLVARDIEVLQRCVPGYAGARSFVPWGKVSAILIVDAGIDPKGTRAMTVPQIVSTLESLPVVSPKNTGKVARAMTEEERNAIVRKYIATKKKAGVDELTITRDGIAKAVSFSGDVVSGTQAWKALAGKKRANKRPRTKSLTGKLAEATQKKDWVAMARLQKQEENNPRAYND